MKEQSQHLDKPKNKLLSAMTQQDYRNLICVKCQFYEPQEEKLECAAFKVLVGLLKSEAISIDQVKGSQAKE